jgi:flagellar hook-associated protein 1 FlgK
MPNLFSGINLALRAVLAHQQAIEVTEHNVANANTPGYRRQEAVLRATVTSPASGLHRPGYAGQMGTGVTVDRIQRFNLEFFDGRYRREIAETRRFELLRDTLTQVELTLAETSKDGLAPKLDAFWSGWQALSDDPSNLALRKDLLERADGLADAVNWRANALLALRQDQNLAVEERVGEINSLADQVARLNVEIPAVQAAGDAPNDLLDERDRLLNRLAELTGATASLQENGEALVSIGGHALVVGRTAFALQTQKDASNLAQISWKIDGKALNALSGELTGLLAARDQIIPAQLDGLNKLAFHIAGQVNALHTSGDDLNGNPGQNFFAAFASTNYALELKVNPALTADPRLIVAAGRVSTTPDAPTPGDGSVAMAIAALRDARVVDATATINGFYTGQIAQLGLDVKEATSRARDRQLVASSLEAMSESVGGVSLDEEAANLVKAQRAFQAASRLMTAIDDMLDRIINGMGTVGR